MATYKKGATITDRPNVLHNGKLHINCKDKVLLRLTGWVEIETPEPKWWEQILDKIIRFEII